MLKPRTPCDATETQTEEHGLHQLKDLPKAWVWGFRALGFRGFTRGVGVYLYNKEPRLRPTEEGLRFRVLGLGIRVCASGLTRSDQAQYKGMRVWGSATLRSIAIATLLQLQ